MQNEFFKRFFLLAGNARDQSLVDLLLEHVKMTEKSETEIVGLFQTMFRTPGRGLQLSYLTVAYIFGEMSHYLVGVTSRDMAREIGYGDMACYNNDNFSEEMNSSIICDDITDSSGCVLSTEKFSSRGCVNPAS